MIGSPDFVFKNMFLKVQKIDPKGRGSMADDFAAGRPTEIDYLNGEVVRLADALGAEAPVNAAIVDLVKQAELGVAADLERQGAVRPHPRPPPRRALVRILNSRIFV